MVYFGPAGLDDSFKAMGYKKTVQAGEFLARYGLNAFEYQCGRGVHIGQDAAKQLGDALRQHDIKVSVHAPYFISMSSLEEEKRIGSVGYIMQSARAISAMGGSRIIFHSGSCAKQPRSEALSKAVNTIHLMQDELDKNGYSDLVLCPETMGKVNQLGSLSEVMELCKADKRITPCIDFGHLNARDQGIIRCKDDYLRIIDTISNELKDERYKYFHAHFSKIEYTVGGEKRHLTFEDTVFGPDWEPLMDVIYENGLQPTVICESDGTQAKDARTMKKYLEAK